MHKQAYKIRFRLFKQKANIANHFFNSFILYVSLITEKVIYFTIIYVCKYVTTINCKLYNVVLFLL